MNATTHPAIQKHGLRGTPSAGLVAATLGNFVGFAGVALYGITAHMFKDVMALTTTQMGLLVAAPQLTGSLLRIPFGALVDKIGGIKPMMILLLLSCVGMLGLSGVLLTLYPHNLHNSIFPILFILGALSGCGVAAFSVGIPQASYWYPENKQGWALGVYGGVGNMAPGIFTILLGFALPVLGLAGSYVAWFIFLVLGSGIYFMIAHDAYYFQLIKKKLSRSKAIEISKDLGQELIPSGTACEALIQSAKTPQTWGLAFLYFTSFGGFLALTTWFPSYWIVHGHFSLKVAAILGGLGFALVAAVIRIGGGYLSDMWGGERTAIFSFTLILIGALMLMSAVHFSLSLTGEICIALGMGIANAAIFKLVAKYIPHAVGGAAGWVGGLGAFGGFVVPPILGMFVDHFGKATGYSKGFIVYVVLALICLVISYMMKRSSDASTQLGM